MALLKFGAFVTDISGKIGGTVFSKNRGGNYAKNKVIPNNPQTDAQSLSRGRFGALSSQWRTLTEQQRESWAAAVQNFPRINRLGDTVILSANALFTSLNKTLLTCGRAINLSAPQAQGVTEFIIGVYIFLFDVDADANSLGIQALPINDAVADNMDIQVYMTPPVSAGVSNVNSLYKLIGVFPGTQANLGADVLPLYLAMFGNPPLGSKVSVRLVPVNINTGEAGTGIESTTIYQNS